MKDDTYVASSLPGGGTGGGDVCRLQLHIVSQGNL